jgi:hypothetical protein
VWRAPISRQEGWMTGTPAFDLEAARPADHVVTLRLAEGEYQALQRKAQELGYSLSQLLRVMIRRQYRTIHTIPRARRDLSAVAAS